LAAVEAVTSGNSGGGQSPLIFQDDLENDLSGWETTGGAWSQTDATAHSPTHSLTDSPFGDYSNDTNVSLWSPVINLPSSGTASLTFWHYYNLETFFDFGNVWVTTDDGATFSWLGSFTGTSDGWVQTSFDLAAFRGRSIRVIFQIFTDSNVTADGWYIDDMAVSLSE
jgi:hypothetical protein